MINIDPNSSVAIYQQIYEEFVKLIVAQVLKSEQKLPSIRELASMLRINPNTIQKAFKLLENNNYIYSVKGVGNFVCRSELYLRFYKSDIEESIEKNVMLLKQMGVKDQTILTMINAILERS